MYKLQMITETQKLELKCKCDQPTSEISSKHWLTMFLFLTADRVLQKHQGLMDFFMEHEEMCTVAGLWQLENAPHNQQAEYVQRCFANLENFQALLLQYAQE